METAEQQLLENELLAQLMADYMAAFEYFYYMYRFQLYQKILNIVWNLELRSLILNF